MKKLSILFFLSITATACDQEDDLIDIVVEAYDWENHQPFETQYNTFSMPFTEKYESTPEEAGPVAISEASGLAWSITNPGTIWTHNDSGNTNSLFLLDAATGKILVRYRISGTVNIDWEDIEVSYGPEEGETYIYLGDTGDNDEKRNQYSIYRFKEPVYEPAHLDQVITLSDVEVDRIRFVYPDGSHDTESLFVDPDTKDIFLVTKRGVVSNLYVAPYPQLVNEEFTVYLAGKFSFRQASAATSSLDGSKIMIKNRQEIFYWERENEETTVDMLARAPVKAPYIGEPQGEAICFDQDYNYYTLSEELNSSIQPILYKYFYKN